MLWNGRQTSIMYQIKRSLCSTQTRYETTLLELFALQLI